MTILLSLLLSAAAPPTLSAPPLARDELRKVLRSRCGSVPAKLTDEAALAYIQAIALPGLRFREHCSRDVRVAARAAATLANAPSLASAEAFALLARLHAGGEGIEADPQRALDYARRSWLLSPSMTDPRFATPEERTGYLAADATIAYLRHRLAAGAPAGESVSLAWALLARRSEGDMVEARMLLTRALELPSPTDEARLLLAEAALEDGAETGDITSAAYALQTVASDPSRGEQARRMLLALGRTQLARAATAEQRWEGIGTLAAAAYANEPEPWTAFKAALRAENGGRDPAATNWKLPFKLPIDVADYPTDALRSETSGKVMLRALIDPSGRIIFSEGTGADQPALLVDAVRRAIARRRLPIARFPAERPTPFVWIDLPAVNFRVGS